MGLDAIERWPQPTRLIFSNGMAVCLYVNHHVGQSQSCMVSKVPIICKQTVLVWAHCMIPYWFAGLQDPWSAGGVLQNISSNPTIIAITNPNGAHHQDLNGGTVSLRHIHRQYCRHHGRVELIDYLCVYERLET